MVQNELELSYTDIADDTIQNLGQMWSVVQEEIRASIIHKALELFSLLSDDDHETPLHMCVQRHDSKFTKILVKANADLNIRDRNGNRPIDIKTENEDVINILKAAMFEKDRIKKPL